MSTHAIAVKVRNTAPRKMFSTDAWLSVYGNGGDAIERERAVADKDREFARAVADLRRSWSSKNG